MNNLSQRSDELQAVGQNILDDIGLMKRLSKIGKVRILGSFAANLMYDPDIDIEVIVSDYNRDKHAQILIDIYKLNYFDSYYIGDWNNAIWRDNFPDGYYLGFKKKLDGIRWKIDVWFITAEEQARRSHLLDISKVTINKKQRDTILRFKRYRRENKLDIDSFTIYDLVLDKNETSPEILDSINTL